MTDRGITPADRRQPDKWWVGRRVRSIGTIETTRGTTFPPGTLFTVTRKWKGLTIRCDKCPHCGIQQSVREIDFQSLVLVEADGEAQS